ncbi:MAG: hypothetical protein GX815_08030 [Clostridiales bacterium]|nr:hypothetical protein [Clostridiales bacterium]
MSNEVQIGPKNEDITDEVLCPKCGALMVRRKVGKERNAGNEFFGCSNFPKCRGILSVK